jgi:hypothetical protein
MPVIRIELASIQSFQQRQKIEKGVESCVQALDFRICEASAGLRPFNRLNISSPLQAGSAVLQAIRVLFLGCTCSCEIEHQRRPPKVLGLTFFGSNPDSADTPLRSQVIQYVPVGGDGLSLKGSNWHATSRSIGRPSYLVNPFILVQISLRDGIQSPIPGT